MYMRFNNCGFAIVVFCSKQIILTPQCLLMQVLKQLDQELANVVNVIAF